jgi:4'-phosphopantetheinyl transferase
MRHRLVRLVSLIPSGQRLIYAAAIVREARLPCLDQARAIHAVGPQCAPMQGIEFELVPLAAGPESLATMARCLSAGEQERAGRLRFARDRRRFVVARARLRERLGARLGCRARDVRIAIGVHGKPFAAEAPELRFSLSHCDELALIAFARGRDVGVDLEALRPVREGDAIAARLFPAAQYNAYAALGGDERIQALCSAWTRKEAYAKALGSGLPATLDTPIVDGWNVESFSPQAGYVAAVAWRE